MNAGVTTVRDESHLQTTPEHTDQLVRALKDSGIRGRFGYGRPGTDQRTWMFSGQKDIPADHAPSPYRASRRRRRSRHDVRHAQRGRR
ncbi:hypothetical protein ACRAWF_39540 [Streptomyces sp. L7]